MNIRSRRAAILAALRQSSWMRAEDLARQFGVSVRTIYRDTAALRKRGVPVKGRTGRGTRLEKGYVLEPIAFTCEEAAMLAIGSTVVAERLSAEKKAVAAAARKCLEAADTGFLAVEVALLENRLNIAPGGQIEMSAALSPIRKAIVRQVALKFHLAKETVSVVLHPYCLVRVSDVWHVVGRSAEEDMVRVYRVDRMRRVELLQETFERPRSYAPAHKSSLTKKDTPIRVQFDAASSTWIVAGMPRFISAVQRKDTGIVVTLEGPATPQVTAWILGWGRHARVVSPVSLRRRIARESSAMAAQYIKSSGDSPQTPPTLPLL